MNKDKTGQEGHSQVEKVYENLMKLPPEQREVLVSRFAAVHESYRVGLCLIRKCSNAMIKSSLTGLKG